MNLGQEFLQDLDSNLREDASNPSFKKMLMRDGSLAMSTGFNSPATSSLPSNVKMIPSHTSFSSLAENVRVEVSQISGAYIENERASSYEHYVNEPLSRKGRGGGGGGRRSSEDRLVRLSNLAMTVKVRRKCFAG